MKKLFLTTATIMMFSTAAFAGDTVKIGVNGMVCDFCARAIEKVFTKNEAIERLSVNLDEQMITAIFKDGQTIDDETLTKMVTDSGYALVDITRGVADE